MNRSMSYLIGMAAGIALGLIFVAIILKKRVKHACDFDERQIAARGKAYKYGFLTAVIYFFMLGLLQIIAEKQFDKIYLWIMAGCGVSLLVFVAVAVWNDAYVSMQQNTKSYVGIFSTVSLVNLIAFAYPLLRHGNLEEMDVNIVNLIMGITFLIIVMIMCAKNLINKRQEEAE